MSRNRYRMLNETGFERFAASLSGLMNLNLRLIFSYLSVLAFELVIRWLSRESFWGIGLLILFFTSIPCALFIYTVQTALPRKACNIAGGAALFAITFVYISQMVYNYIFHDFYTLFSASKIGMVLSFFTFIMEAVRNNILPIIIMFLPLLIYVLFIARKVPINESPALGRRFPLIIFGAVYMAFVAFMIPAAVLPDSAYGVFFGQGVMSQSVNSAGLTSAMHIDILRGILPDNNNAIAYVPEYTVAPVPAQSALSSESAYAYVEIDVPKPYMPVPTPVPSWIGKQNAMNIDFSALIAKETDPNVKALHEYFAAKAPTNQNPYTGMFEGYNVITITAEGFSSIAVDPEYTPTLYKLVHEGFYFENFYNPSWSVSTSDGEYVAMNGLIPKSGVWSFSKSSKNFLPFTMGMQFVKLGITPRAYHNHTYSYYDRNLSHPNMGYDYKGLGNGLEVTKQWPESDIEMMELTVDEYIGDERFHTYYMTVSGHMNYTFAGNKMAQKNRDLVTDFPMSDNCKAYMACQIELDRALEYLLKRLNEQGIAEKTLIVLTGDHYPYGLTPDEISEFLGHTVEQNFEMYKSNLIIYAQGMKPETVTKPCASMDIIPTISNLLGLEYDSRMLMGSDIFSDSPGLVIMSNRSFISEIGSWNFPKREFIANEGVEVPDKYRSSMSAAIDAKFDVSKKILELDYFNRVPELKFSEAAELKPKQ